jgi:glucose-1-phosphate thymidylyltransferase
MKALIPAAGAGTRLLPFTHTRPKPLIFVAGKPILGHILESLKGVVDEVVIIVGYMKEKLMEFVDGHYGEHFKVTYVEQKRRLGLGHAILLGKEAVGDEPVLITLGDEVFGITFKQMVDIHDGLGDCAASLGIKEVDNPSNYGVVELEGGRITRLVEKPADPPASTAIAGVYIVNDSPALWGALEGLAAPKMSAENGGNSDSCGVVREEIQLTDGLQRMVEGGHTLMSFQLDEWYDAGRPNMLLDVNEVLLEQLGSSVRCEPENSVVIEPSSIEAGCRVVNSVVGPNVSVAEGTVIENCILRRTIVGAGSYLENISLTDTIIGDGVKLRGNPRRMNVGDSTEITL